MKEVDEMIKKIIDWLSTAKEEERKYLYEELDNLTWGVCLCCYSPDHVDRVKEVWQGECYVRIKHCTKCAEL